MNGKWGRFGAFIVAAALIVAAVVLGTGGGTRTWTQFFIQVTIIAVGVYATTFVVWPRSMFRRSSRSVARQRQRVPVDVVRGSDLDEGPSPLRIKAPQPDDRPVAIIKPRPAGSQPGSRVHIPESPTVRNPRGRPVGGREPSKDFRWPAQR